MTQPKSVADRMEGLEVAGSESLMHDQGVQTDPLPVQMEETAGAREDENKMPQLSERTPFQRIQSQVGFSFGLLDEIENGDQGGDQEQTLDDKDGTLMKTNSGSHQPSLSTPEQSDREEDSSILGTKPGAISKQTETTSSQPADQMEGVLTRDDIHEENRMRVDSTPDVELRSRTDSSGGIADKDESNTARESGPSENHLNAENAVVHSPTSPCQHNTEPMPNPSKQCLTCFLEKPLDQFYRKSSTTKIVKNCQACRKLSSKQQYRVRKDAVARENQRRESENKDNPKEAKKRCTKCMNIQPLADFFATTSGGLGAAGTIWMTCASCRLQNRERLANHNAGLRKCQRCQQAFPEKDFSRAGTAKVSTKNRICDSCEEKGGRKLAGLSKSATEPIKYDCEVCGTEKVVTEFLRQGKHIHPCNDCAGRRDARKLLLGDSVDADPMAIGMPTVSGPTVGSDEQHGDTSIITRSKTRDALLSIVQRSTDQDAVLVQKQADHSHKRNYPTDEDEPLLPANKSKTGVPTSSHSIIDTNEAHSGRAVTDVQMVPSRVLRSGLDLPTERRQRKLEKRTEIASKEPVTKAAAPNPSPWTKLYDDSMSITRDIFELGREYFSGNISLEELAMKQNLTVGEDFGPEARRSLLLYLREVLPGFHNALAILLKDDLFRKVLDDREQRGVEALDCTSELNAQVPGFRDIMVQQIRRWKLRGALEQLKADQIEAKGSP